MKLIETSSSGEPMEPISERPAVAADVCSGYVNLYRSAGFVPPWVGYLAMVNSVCVWTCGFKAPPANNRVEIAFFTLPDHEGRGFATQMAQALIEVARRADSSLVIAAQTLPQGGASTAILRKLGFNLVGTVNHPEDGEVWEWQYARQGAEHDA